MGGVPLSEERCKKAERVLEKRWLKEEVGCGNRCPSQERGVRCQLVKKDALTGIDYRIPVYPFLSSRVFRLSPGRNEK